MGEVANGLVADYLAPKGAIDPILDEKRMLLFKRFVEFYELTDWRQGDPELLVGIDGGDHKIGYLDHHEVFYRDGKPWIFTAQPYEIDSGGRTQVLENLFKFCKGLGLHCFLSSYSWWYPGSTVLIGVESKGATEWRSGRYAPFSRAQMDWVASDDWAGGKA